jgi:hypothetical protein
VVITLGAAAIAAAAGAYGSYLAFRGARLTAREQAREAWRSRMREAAEDFCVVSNSIGWATRTALFDDPEDRRVDRENLDAQWKELRRAQIRVDLAFGVTSPSSDTAAELVSLLQAGVVALSAWSLARVKSVGEDEDPEKWVQEAQVQFMKEEATYDAFLQAAHDAISPEPD